MFDKAHATSSSLVCRTWNRVKSAEQYINSQLDTQGVGLRTGNSGALIRSLPQSLQLEIGCSREEASSWMRVTRQASVALTNLCGGCRCFPTIRSKGHLHRRCLAFECLARRFNFEMNHRSTVCRTASDLHGQTCVWPKGPIRHAIHVYCGILRTLSISCVRVCYEKLTYRISHCSWLHT